jgi:hypothetical protein
MRLQDFEPSVYANLERDLNRDSLVQWVAGYCLLSDDEFVREANACPISVSSQSLGVDCLYPS